MEIREIDQSNRKAIDDFIIGHWFTLRMAVRGGCVDLGSADGWYACEGDEIIGLVTFRAREDELEILSLDSLRESQGIGTALVNEVVSKAKAAGIPKITVITTNDNLRALRFYQKRGFDMIKLHRGAVDRARAIKSEIPLTGLDGIPLRHEIELEMEL